MQATTLSSLHGRRKGPVLGWVSASLMLGFEPPHPFEVASVGKRWPVWERGVLASEPKEALWQCARNDKEARGLGK